MGVSSLLRPLGGRRVRKHLPQMPNKYPPNQLVGAAGSAQRKYDCNPRSRTLGSCTLLWSKFLGCLATFGKLMRLLP